ncbi:MAG: ABC transporter substrate-binding protein, partial [Rickettsiales bacterium]
MRILIALSVFSIVALFGTPSWAEEVAPKGLKVACGSVGIELKLCKEAVETWSKKAGYPASIVSMPQAATERLALYQQFLSAKQSSIDIFQIDVIWPGILNSHLMDLKSYIPQDEIDRHFESIIENNTIDGKLVAMPLYTDVGILYYRKDLLKKYGLRAPQTWEELTATARKIQEGERADGISDFWGFVWQGKREGLTCNAMEWVYSEGGGTIVGDDGKITIINDEAIKALSRAASWVGDITPQGVLNYTEEESRGVFQSGKAAFMRNWPYAWSLSQSEDSPVKGKVGVSVLPRGSEKGDVHTGTLGGWQMAISKYSEQKEKAVELLRYLTGPEVQRQYALQASYNPTIKSLYKEQAVLNALPAADVLYEALAHAVARPSRVTGFRYNQVSAGFSNTL